MIRPALLTLALLAAAAPALQAQTHLGVPAKDLTTIQVNYFDDGTGTMVKQWAEKRFGVGTGLDGETYTPNTKKETLVITDAEFTVYCSAPSTTAPVFSPLIDDATGKGWLYPTRVRPTLSAPGREQIHVSFTSGAVLPPGYMFEFPVMQAGSYTVERAIFYGYYTK